MAFATLLERLLRGVRPVPADDASAWWRAHREATATLPVFGRAVLGGARADRLAWAFAAGYEAALATLVPDRDASRTAALCATETGGAHPAKITTRLGEDGRLSGDKTFVTLAESADDLLVLARRGTMPDGKADLVLVEIASDTPGVTLGALPQMPFVPEIPHASVRFAGARVGRVLPGDGWTRYVKPFRTVEDIHVHAAFLGFLVARGLDWGLPRPPLERAVGAIGTLAALWDDDPSSAGTHVALAGVIATTRDVVLELDRADAWSKAPPEDRERWARDRPLLEVAGRARAERLARAWEELGRAT